MEAAFVSIIKHINLQGYCHPTCVKKFFEELLTQIYIKYRETSQVVFELKEEIDNIWRMSTYKCLLEHVKGLLKKQGAVFNRENSLDSSRLISEIKKYIQDNITSDLSLNSIASNFFLNKYYFSHLFKKETGMNFIDYVTSLRIEKAKEMLKDVSIKVYEVAEKIGYADQRYFSQLFKKYTGFTPRAYREKRS